MDENINKFKVIKTYNNPKLTLLKKLEKFKKVDQFINKKPNKILMRNCLVSNEVSTQR